MEKDLGRNSGSPVSPENRSLKDTEANSGQQRFWSNGKPRLDKPSCIRPRNRKGNLVEEPGKVKKGKTRGKGTNGTKSSSGKRSHPRSALENIPVKKAPSGPRSNTRKYRSLDYEFKHTVIGRAHNLGVNTKKKAFSDIKQICNFMQGHPVNLNSIRSMSPEHIKTYAKAMIDGDVVSKKTSDLYEPATVYDRIGRACWMYEVMNQGQVLEPKHIGVQKLRIDVHKPIDFSKHPDYVENRAAIHDFFRSHPVYGWTAPGDRLGQEFGLRELERAGTRANTITRVNGELYIDKGQEKGYEKVTTKKITSTYGHSSYANYTSHVKEGGEYLVVEWSKDALGRFVPIDRQSQWDSIREVREACKTTGSKGGRIIPENMTKKQAEKALTNAWQAVKKEFGLKGKDNYAYSCNGDRGRYVQDLCEMGLPDKLIIIRMGHFDTDKLDFYRDKANYR